MLCETLRCFKHLFFANFYYYGIACFIFFLIFFFFCNNYFLNFSDAHGEISWKVNTHELAIINGDFIHKLAARALIRDWDEVIFVHFLRVHFCLFVLFGWFENANKTKNRLQNK